MKKLDLQYDINRLNKIFYSHEQAQPLLNPSLVSKNSNMLEKLGLDEYDDLFLVKLLNGEILQDSNQLYAWAYSGHQFGYFVPNLGDGRALNIGKLKNYHLQTKGSGQTEYSRHGDGRAVLRSSIREYLISEAMYGLGIPTTRAVALITSDSQAFREYRNEDCAIVLRASTSWIRFGTFEYARFQHSKELIQELADYVIDESYPHLKGIEQKYEELYFSIVDKTIELLANWQSVGFAHGVMNTDNMSIEGLTIDYGPYAFMEKFDTEFICNRSDHEGRYSFENQPYIAQWNLLILAGVFGKIANYDVLQSYANQFIGKFKHRYYELLSLKLGFTSSCDDKIALIRKMLNMLEWCGVDYTVFFYYLTINNIDGVLDMSSDKNHTREWLDLYQNTLEKEYIDKNEKTQRMKKINPKYVLKNYMLQEAIDLATKGDYGLVNDLLKIAQNPYGEHKEYEHYSQPIPQNIASQICSCSS
jgi:uncharacterized protein YdiU (UPF0061 family)